MCVSETRRPTHEQLRTERAIETHTHAHNARGYRTPGGLDNFETRGHGMLG